MADAIHIALTARIVELEKELKAVVDQNTQLCLELELVTIPHESRLELYRMYQKEIAALETRATELEKNLCQLLSR